MNRRFNKSTTFNKSTQFNRSNRVPLPFEYRCFIYKVYADGRCIEILTFTTRDGIQFNRYSRNKKSICYINEMMKLYTKNATGNTARWSFHQVVPLVKSYRKFYFIFYYLKYNLSINDIIVIIFNILKEIDYDYDVAGNFKPIIMNYRYEH